MGSYKYAFIEKNSSFFEKVLKNVVDSIKNEEIELNNILPSKHEWGLLWIILFIDSFKILYVREMRDQKIDQSLWSNNYINRDLLISNLGKNIMFLKLIDLNIEKFDLFFKRKLLVLESSEQLIVKISRELKIENNNKTLFKTIIFIKLALEQPINLYNNIPLFFSKKPFLMLKKKYLIGASYLTLLKILKKSEYQKTFNKISDSGVIAASNVKLFIEADNKNYLKNYLYNMLNKINNKDEYVNLDEIIKIWDELISQINFTKEKLNSLKVSRKEVSDLIEEIKEFESASEIQDWKKELSNLWADTFKLKKELSKLYTKQFDIWNIHFTYKNVLNIEGGFYLPYYMDWRGRQYSESILGPTYNRMNRYLIHFKPLNNFNSVITDRILKSKYFNKVIGYEMHLNQYKTNNTMTNYFLLVLFIELGKLNKTSLIQNQFQIPVEDFISEGIKIFKRDNHLFETYDIELIYLNKIKNTITDIIDNTKIDINTLILRDSTASVMQHWSIILKPKDHKICEYLNLNGNAWMDTYSYIIHLYVTSYLSSSIPDTYKKYINRKYLKRTIMTINYNAKPLTTSKYFFEDIWDDLNILPEEEKNQAKIFLSNFHNNFYKFITHPLFNKLYELNIDSYRTVIKNNDYTIQLSDANINLKYFIKSKNNQIRSLKYKGLRTRYSISELSDDFDLKKTLQGLEPNIIQSLDAELVRFLFENEIPMFAIHDSFGVALANIDLLMDKVNYYFNQKLNNRYDNYSLFVLL